MGTPGEDQQALALRARIVLACADEHRPDTQIARDLGVYRSTVAKWRGLHFHFTPTSALWINLVERWFALLTKRQLRRGTHRSTYELEKAIREFLEVHNQAPRPFVWTKTADQILDSLARFCRRVSDSGH